MLLRKLMVVLLIFRNVCADHVNVSFIYGKSRLAPLNNKSLTIPKLELQAAVTAVRIKVKLLQEVELKCSKIYFWSDSKTVLSYIKNENKKYSVYVTHRVNEIRNCSNTDEWHYVPTKLNVADTCTRVVNIDQMVEENSYINGPDYLYQNPLPDISNNVVIIENLNLHVNETKESYLENHSVILWERFSRWKKLVRVIAYVLLLIAYCLCLFINIVKSKLRYKLSKCLDELSTDELNQSKQVIYYLIQQDCYKEDISCILQNKFTTSRKLQPLTPFVKDNLLLVRGRLKNIDLPDSFKHPIILPKEHHVTSIIVKFYHETYHHCGREHLSSIIRETF